MDFTPLAISTMTCTFRLVLPVHGGRGGAAALELLAAGAALAAGGGPGVVSVRGPGGRARGEPFPVTRGGKAGGAAFGVQVTASARVPSQARPVHAKVFGTGMVQMAGAASDAAAREAAAALASAFGADGGPLELRTRMINSSFRASTRLNLSRCYTLLRAAGFAAMYDPCRYSAVKVSVFLGEHGGGTDGVCRCPCSCLGKRPRHRRCRMVTASLFHSGAIGVSGGTCEQHLRVCAGLVCAVLSGPGADAAQPADAAILALLRAIE